MEAACTNGLYKWRRHVPMEAACTNEGGMHQWRRHVPMAYTNGGGCIYIFMYQASSTVSSVISSSESVDLSKLELLFSTLLAR